MQSYIALIHRLFLTYKMQLLQSHGRVRLQIHYHNAHQTCLYSHATNLNVYGFVRLSYHNAFYIFHQFHLHTASVVLLLFPVGNIHVYAQVLRIFHPGLLLLYYQRQYKYSFVFVKYLLLN